MSKFVENILIKCSGVIEYQCGDTTCTGYINFPCGASFDTKVTGGGFQLPYKYQIYRERARLATCCYWAQSTQDLNALDPTAPSKEDNDPEIFEFKNVSLTSSGILPKITVINSTTQQEEEIEDPDLDVVGGWAHETQPSFVIAPRVFNTILLSGALSVPTRCQNSKASYWHQGLDSTPPCNGAKTECPFYTGPVFQYINDYNLAPGQPIMGEMVQELRSLLKDWKKYTNPQEQWEKEFDLPYIWSKDFKDVPMAIYPDPDETNESPDPYTILTRVYWEVKGMAVKLDKYPSNPESTEITKDSGTHPPNFPTFVSNLGVSNHPVLEITYPRVVAVASDYPTQPTQDKPFIKVGFEINSNLTYLAGFGPPVSNIFCINTTILTDFPSLIEDEQVTATTTTSDEEISKKIKEYLSKYATFGKFSGFSFTTADETRFWEFPEGILLTVNNGEKFLNKLIVLTQVKGKWYYEVIYIKYKFYHADILQEGSEIYLQQPSTSLVLPNRLANFNTDQLQFTLQPICGDVEIYDVYQWTVLDRSLTRFVRDSELPKNQRTWKVIKNVYSITGSKVSGNLRWYKLDRCNRYVVTILDPVLSYAIPAGLDRSWEPKNIIFSIKLQSEASEQEQVVVNMKVVANPEVGRSLDGIFLPINTIIIEPEQDDQALRTPTENSLISMDIEEFLAVSIETEGEDALVELLDDYSDNNTYLAAGIPITPPAEDDDLVKSSEITWESDTITVETPQKYELSYFIELRAKDLDIVIGRKWFYGVAEKTDTWVRDVSIRYRWFAGQIFKKLLPDYRKSISCFPSFNPINSDQFGDTFTPAEKSSTVFHPKCGDHNMMFGRPGPMFTPYEACDRPKIETDYLGLIINKTIVTTFNYGDVMEIDEKYRKPDASVATIYKHNVLGTIFPNCFFEYSMGTLFRVGGISFSAGGLHDQGWYGVGKLRGPIGYNANSVKALLFDTYGWRKPPLGNAGREHLRVFKSLHYREFIYFAGGNLQVGIGWLPAFPFLSNYSLFNKTLPRNYLEQTYQAGLLDLGIEYSKKSSAIQLLNFSSDGVEIANSSSSLDKEEFYLERKKFDDIYKVRKIRNKDGQGAQWPPQGFYFNFRNPNVVWAHPEPVLELLRDESLATGDVFSTNSFIGGIQMKNPLLSIVERYGRPIHLSLPEDTYILQIKNPTYDSDGNIIEEANVYISEDLRLYFDRFTGEILEKANQIDSELPEELYTVTTVSGLIDYFSSKALAEPIIESYFEYINQTQENTAPTELSELGNFINYGNIYLQQETLFIYPTEGLEGPLDDTDTPWIGFFPSIKVESISPRYMPKVELKLDIYGESFIGIKPTHIFSDFPATTLALREIFSGDPVIEGDFVTFISTEENPEYDQFDWKPFVKEDIAPAVISGQTEAFTIETEFKYPIELSELQFSYTIYGQEDTNPDSPLSPPNPIPPKIDPSLLVILVGADNITEYILVDKERVDVKRANLTIQTTFERQFKFKYTTDTTEENTSNETSSALEDPIVIKKIKFMVGSRGSQTGFKLSKLHIKALKLNESITEEILVLEPKYMPTVGYYNDGDNNHLWAQDPNKLTAGVAAPDIPDELEAANICEFWRPPNNDVGTKGKLRRHWANRMLTFDTDSTNPDMIFFSEEKDVFHTEGRQKEIIVNFLDIFKEDPFDTFFNDEFLYFMLPYDLYLISKQLKLPVPYKAGQYKTFVRVKEFDPDTVAIVSKGFQSDPWEFEGYYACLNPKTVIEKCFGCTGPTYEFNHSYCHVSDPTSYGITMSLIDLPRVLHRGRLMGTDPSSALAQREGGITEDKYTQQYSKQQSLQNLLNQKKEDKLNDLQERVSEYLKKNDRYKE